MANEGFTGHNNGTTTTVRCGTPSGFRKHQKDGEKPCDACTRAKQEYDQRWRSQPRRTLASRASAKAQARSLKRLKDKYPDEYREYYAEEKVIAYTEAGLISGHPTQQDSAGPSE